jgi:DNA-binding NarL/FixJ family response regulator
MPSCSNNACRLFLVDEHPVVLSCLAGLFARQPGLRPCGAASSLDGSAGQIVAAEADLLVIDIGIGHIAGLDFIETMRGMLPALRVVCYSVLDEAVFAERALRAGASGYVMKTSGFPVLLEAIHDVRSGRLFLSEAVRSRLLRRLAAEGRRGRAAHLDALSNRELQVIYHIGEKRGVPEIARRISTDAETVVEHQARIKAKLALRSLRELADFASRWVESDAGIVEPAG